MPLCSVIPSGKNECDLWVACGLGPYFGAQPLYIQQQYLSTEARTIRMYDSGGTPSTVSFAE